ncbi:helix-turn-helix domain-containing protein [Candidatus Bipolaricaulota bacterium]
MSRAGISFRWGIPELDRGNVMIPEPICRFHGEVGVKANYFVLIVQLAAFKYESRRGKSKPSLSTIAERMGVSRRRVIELVKKLEDDGWLTVRRKDTDYGDPDNNEYSFEPFAKACWALYQGGGEEFHTTQRGAKGSAESRATPSEESRTTVVKNSAPPTKEEELKNKKPKNKNTSANKPRFPADWYRQNEENYQRIKGIKLRGPELGPLQRDLKLIYRAGHSPDDVRAFAEALEASEEVWTDSWTITTVRRKLAEFKAGKLFNGMTTQTASRAGPAPKGTARDPSIYEKAGGAE